MAVPDLGLGQRLLAHRVFPGQVLALPPWLVSRGRATPALAQLQYATALSNRARSSESDGVVVWWCRCATELMSFDAQS